MDVTALLFTAFTLLGVGMTFVFLFLGLLLIAVKLLERYVPADLPVTQKRKKTRTNTSTVSTVSPLLVAAITTAVQQYRKTESV